MHEQQLSLSILETHCFLCDEHAESQQYLVALANSGEKKKNIGLVLSKKTNSFDLSELSVCFRVEQLCSHWKHFHENLYWKTVQKAVEK